MSEPKLNPLSLTPADAARLLSKVGGVNITEDQIREALAAGAPVNPSDTLNLVHFGAWLLRETKARGVNPLIVIGSGVTGAEFASAYNALGVQPFGVLLFGIGFVLMEMDTIGVSGRVRRGLPAPLIRSGNRVA